MRWRSKVAADDGVDVIPMTPEEYQAAVSRSLGDLGLTYGQLARQASEGRFSSSSAADLWALVRGTLPVPGDC